MKINLGLLVLGIFLSSCASTFQYKSLPQTTSTSQELATIYVLRPSSFGSAIKFNIYEEDSLIGKLGPNSYIAWQVNPSGKELTIISKSENKETISINPKPGETYYIKQRVKVGYATVRSGLEYLDETEGKNILKKVKAPKIK